MSTCAVAVEVELEDGTTTSVLCSEQAGHVEQHSGKLWWSQATERVEHVHTTIHEYKDGVHTEIHESRPVLDVQVSRNISPLEEDEIRRLGGGCR